MRWLVVGVGAVARGVCLAPRPPPPFQVPSASRRGGLKTPGGVARPPWGRGGRARGESGGASRLPQTPPSPCVGPGWRVAWRATVTAAAAAGRGLPGGRCAGRGRVRCVRAPLASLGEGGNPPGACGVSEPALAGWRWMAPLCETFPRPLRSAVFLSDLAGQRQLPTTRLPTSPAPQPRGGKGRRGRRVCRARGGFSRRNKTLEKNLVRLLAVDHSARASMKNAASCEN